MAIEFCEFAAGTKLAEARSVCKPFGNTRLPLGWAEVTLSAKAAVAAVVEWTKGPACRPAICF
ncbi:MAG: hypothetical protein G01um101472_21 [Parcubacteria group bacterium Gr01-1014_72]|nr:MAG: hypothetical protein G01um101472_21 [Parcubacteria group bacterium Gr01-1014_72]